MTRSPAEALAHVRNFRSVVVPEEINRALAEAQRKWVAAAITQTSGAYNFDRRVAEGSRRTYTRVGKSKPGWFPYSDPLIINIETGELVRSWSGEVSTWMTRGTWRLRLMNSSYKATALIRGNDIYMPRPFDEVLHRRGRELLLFELRRAKARIMARWA